ncbi:hypothetical protein [Psychroflexus aestuariivivens]|uniref:hypothetical protein n=1 Tax=Psychroflexus aestuariivivens TaxID=1795040 RepID=UPI000FDBE066|nr:hypothetical protein [Psychroflexus aestuariivivens]
MGRTLGLDLGTNSIGWAIIENNKIIQKGVRVLPNNEFRKEESRIKRTNLISEIKTNSRLIALIFLTLSLFGMGILMPKFWQFWLNLGIAGIFTTLTIERKR